MAHWSRLPESRLEVTRPDGSSKGKHLAPACLIANGTDTSILTGPHESTKPRMSTSAENIKRSAEFLAGSGRGWLREG